MTMDMATDISITLCVYITFKIVTNSRYTYLSLSASMFTLQSASTIKLFQLL